MSMSQNTKFTLNNNKEEIEIKWDMKNGEFQLLRSKLPDIDKGSEISDKGNGFTIRTRDLNPETWAELAQMIHFGFEKLFCTEGYGDFLDEDIECDLTSLLDDEEDEDEEEN
jgi:hypothetical protein